MINLYTYLEVYLDDLTKKVNLNEFERYFKRPHQTIKAHLQELVDAKVLIIDKKVRLLFYSLNLSNPLLKEYLALCEKERLLTFLKKPLFKRLYDHIAKSLVKSKVMIFGSAVNKDGFGDIDMLIISNDRYIRKSINDFIKTYDVKIHIIQTADKYLTKSFIAEVKKQHIFLNEHDYFIRELYKDELRMV